ncbi:hypothetical protein AB0D45_10710 [Streptomyces sp. NPDC048352]|uniref:hypothetical protein n=1 Tax=Streptomyces sp. NPDC048352 TaxID=3154718 RepID=UPI0034161917
MADPFTDQIRLVSERCGTCDFRPGNRGNLTSGHLAALIAGRIDSNRQSAAVELVAYLALNPGADHHAIDDALWPGRLVNKQMRNATISRTGSWLGKNEDGEAYFPRVQDAGDSRYRLASAVRCDWRNFQHLARTGLARHDEDGELARRRALGIVRGRPFAAIDPQRYAWAEPAVQEMVSAPP